MDEVFIAKTTGFKTSIDRNDSFVTVTLGLPHDYAEAEVEVFQKIVQFVTEGYKEPLEKASPIEDDDEILERVIRRRQGM